MKEKKRRETLIAVAYLYVLSGVCWCNEEKKRRETDKEGDWEKERENNVGSTITEGSSSPRDKEQNRQLAVDEELISSPAKYQRACTRVIWYVRAKTDTEESRGQVAEYIVS